MELQAVQQEVRALRSQSAGEPTALWIHDKMAYPTELQQEWRSCRDDVNRNGCYHEA